MSNLDIDDMEDIIDPMLMRRPSGRRIAVALHKVGFRQIFDGDCGLSRISDPTDVEAAEAWMRWANLAMNDETGAIGAMKRMLTELGYRKQRADK